MRIRTTRRPAEPRRGRRRLSSALAGSLLCLPGPLAPLVISHGYYTIPASSMTPTALVEDQVLTAEYGSDVTRQTQEWLGVWADESDAPARGDVVVALRPAGPNGSDVPFIRRIIGLPGDRLRIEDNVIFLNDVPVRRDALEDYAHRTNDRSGCAGAEPTGGVCLLNQFRETLPNGVAYRVIENGAGPGFLANHAEIAIPDGHYFLMGDHRHNARDSRSPDLGLAPAAAILGRVQAIARRNHEARVCEAWIWVDGGYTLWAPPEDG